MCADAYEYTGRRRALDKAMDAALKNPTKRRRKIGEVVSHRSLPSNPIYELTTLPGPQQHGRRRNRQPPHPHGRSR